MTARRRFLSASVSVLKAGALWSAGGLLVGCGFRLRQAPAFAFQTLVATLPDASPLRRELKLGLQSAGVTVINAPPPSPNPQADAVLEILGDQREKSVVGSTTAGQVREFQLKLRFRFKLSTPKGKELIPDTEVLVQRDISYSESIALSKAEEEAELYRDMQTDVVQQVLRRLAALRSL